MLRTVILSGELGKRFGREFRFDIKSPAEAIRALCANFKDFRSALTDSANRGVAYKVIVDKTNIAGDAYRFPGLLHEPFSRTVRIVPVITGSKDGFLGVVLGAVLIGASFFLPAAPLFALGSFAPSLSSIAFGLGASMALGGISQMLARTPKAGAPAERPENTPSTYFNGALNSTRQGQGVPVGYGRGIVGSHVGSQGLTADDYGAAGIA